MSYIFISYSKQNKDYAGSLADRLLSLGFDVWIDDRIDYGEDWWREIVKAIRGCAAFIVIMTPESEASRWVQREVTLADSQQKPAFPLLLAGDPDLSTSDEWSIYVRTQYADVRHGGFPPEDYLKRVANLVPRKLSRGINLGDSTSDTEEADQTPSEQQILPPPFDWVEVPGGQVTLEETGGYLDKPADFHVESFQIAKYPITNAQFKQFVDAGGYWHDSYWTEAGWQECLKEPWTAPRLWNDPPWNGADLPVVGVSWYEAVAFCNWLNETRAVNQPGENTPPLQVRLPTEQEWQRAAQGDDQRPYPWGSTFDKLRANTAESEIGKTNRVQQYRGKNDSPFGVVGLTGNVWEWCLTSWRTADNALEGTSSRVARGGCWSSSQSLARVTFRYWALPNSRYNTIGFRIVRATPV